MRSTILMFGAVFGIGALWTGGAQAVPSYGFAELSFSNFTVTNFPNASGVISSTGSANYPGYSSVIGSGNNTVATGFDLSQFSTGPGPFPGQNTFVQALLPASASTPAGTRADSRASANVTANGSFDAVSEGKLAVAGGAAGSAAGTTITLQGSVASAQVIVITFNASAAVQASVGATGDTAMAAVTTSLTLLDTTTGNYALITDNINAANSGTTISPLALNRSVTARDATSPQGSTTGLSAFSYSALLAANDVYTLVLSDATSESLTTLAAVPEPATLELLGVGVLGMAVARRRLGSA